jgi:hypothetical protein
MIKARGVTMVLAADYYPHNQVTSVAERSGTKAKIVPFNVGSMGARSYPELVDAWVEAIADGIPPREAKR